MYYYVFLQPEVFEEAAADGEDATQNVAGMLGGFLQNCFLAVFQDDRWGTTVKEGLESWPSDMNRKRVTSILVQLRKHNRFLYCIAPDYQGRKTDLDCVFEQADSVGLDLTVVISSEGERTAPAGIEVSTRRTYQGTAFEPRRSAVNGRTCQPGEMDETDFMEFHFAKALKYATEIHICDRVCGRKHFMENFRYTVRRLMAWLGSALAMPENCRIIFHFGQPDGQGVSFVLDEIKSFRRGRLSRTVIEVNFYDQSLPDPALPHQRFIRTDQVALNVDRGLDFLDPQTQRCRDTYINYQNPEEAQRLLNSYSSGRVSSHVI